MKLEKIFISSHTGAFQAVVITSVKYFFPVILPMILCQYATKMKEKMCVKSQIIVRVASVKTWPQCKAADQSQRLQS